MREGCVRHTFCSHLRASQLRFMTQKLHLEGPAHKDLVARTSEQPAAAALADQDFIKGSVAKSSYPSIQKPQDFSLTTHDVDGAQPKARSAGRVLRLSVESVMGGTMNKHYLSRGT